MKRKPSTALSPGYGRLLADIKARVQAAQIRAHLAANGALLALYGDIGRLILDRQQAEGWGTKVIERLSLDLQNEFPGQQGFSPRNLNYMRAFAEAWPETAIVQQPAAQIPWTHHCLLLDKLKAPSDRLWYAAKAVEHGWSRNVLALQIESGLHARQGGAVTNFKATLPPPQSDLAQQITKDPYVFDFLTLRDEANERAVEDALLAHVEKFLLELGVGFALVGRQVHLEVGNQDFYLSAVDDRFRQPGDQPSIGIILCRDKNRVMAEYALRDLQKPIGVSGYVTQLVESLPKPLRAAVPSVQEMEGQRSSSPRPPRPRKPKKS